MCINCLSQQVENYLFRFDISRLKVHSGVLKEILEIPPSGPANEGSEENPIRLDGTVSAQALTSFLRWFNHMRVISLHFCCSGLTLISTSEWSPLPLGEEALVDILTVSHMWMIEAGTSFAKSRLRQLQPPLPFPRLLQLGIKFGIRDWIFPAVEGILFSSLGSIDIHDTERIPYRAFVVLAKAREAVLQQRNVVGMYPPPFECGCISNQGCLRKWKEAWRATIGPRVLNPGTSLPLTQIPVIARENYKAFSLSDACIRTAIDNLVEKGAFSAETIILDKAVQGILDIFSMD